MSASIGLDDPVVWHRTSVYNLAYGLNAVGTGSNAYAGVRAPDIVGNIRVDQAWRSMLQISGSAHQVRGSYDFLTVWALRRRVGVAGASPTALSEIGGHPDTKWGGSVMAGLQIEKSTSGAGDDIKLDATYALGDTKNVISTSSTSPSFAMFGSSGRPGAYQSVGFGATTDAVWLPNHATTGSVGALGDGELKLTEAYGLRGAFNHNWDAYLVLEPVRQLFGCPLHVAVRVTCTLRKGLLRGLWLGKAVSADFACNPDFNVSHFGV